MLTDVKNFLYGLGLLQTACRWTHCIRREPQKSRAASRMQKEREEYAYRIAAGNEKISSSAE